MAKSCLLTLIVVMPTSAIAEFTAPKMPPIPTEGVDAQPPKDNYLWKYYNDPSHPEKVVLPPAPLTEVVTPENPLKVDVYYSMRSPYSYLALHRLMYLNSVYNVDVTVRVVLPIAVRAPGSLFKKQEPGKVSGRWYKWTDAVHDTFRQGKFLGVPFRFASPDPIKQDTYPPGESSMVIAPIEEQPWIVWITRLGSAAELAGKSNEYVWAVSPLIWGGQAPIGKWPEMVPAAFERGTGLDYEATIKDIQANPQKYDAVWLKHQQGQLKTGHGGVPNMVFRGEPFFGQDRVDPLVWRLQQNGLTERPEPIEPIVSKPLRWID
jgi:2-hydroxychromene-2-carboxylate isomerase